MPRTYAKLYVEVWAADSDFRELSATAQRLYWLLCSQDELTSAGVLPIRARRWSHFAADTTEADVRSDLAELNAARKVLIDDDTEELLVRSFIRRDEGWRTPNIRKSIERAIANIESETLRDLAEYELRRAIAEHNKEPFTEPLPKGLAEGFGNESSIEHNPPKTSDLPPDNAGTSSYQGHQGEEHERDISSTIGDLSRRLRA